MNQAQERIWQAAIELVRANLCSSMEEAVRMASRAMTLLKEGEPGGSAHSAQGSTSPFQKMVTRQQAINLYGSAASLAEALGYSSRHAVYMWNKTGPIPREPYMRLRYELKPECFGADGRVIGNVVPLDQEKM